MNEIQPQLELEHIPKPVGLSFEQLDLIVQSSQGRRRDTVIEVGKEPLTMCIQSSS